MNRLLKLCLRKKNKSVLKPDVKELTQLLVDFF